MLFQEATRTTTDMEILAELSTVGILAGDLEEIDSNQVVEFFVSSWQEMKIAYKAVNAAFSIIDDLTKLSRFSDNFHISNAWSQCQATKFHFKELQRTLKAFDSILKGQVDNNDAIRAVVAVMAGMEEYEVDAGNFDIETIRARLMEFSSIMEMSKETFEMIKKAFDEVDRIDSNKLRERSGKLSDFYAIQKTLAKRSKAKSQHRFMNHSCVPAGAMLN